ncbi:nicotinamide riboside transporter PnuC [Apibacter muscae]|uniref:nicotinamide riboside transporter PnuC n=1 Tax=Apibacter muscae TaxID=2509004 RepID=UPI0011ACD30F|nr:nicotinamide riboside transporter PnuC [Apibacter muscae]TWP27963.1 nicotinamide riboside transporter PnuC [Apibacter muscae]
MEIFNSYLISIIEQFYGITWLEFIGVFFAVLQVLFAKANKVWLYPCGIISICITSYLYFEIQLYAEILLQLYYLIMSIYGWMLWKNKKGEGSEISLSSNSEKRKSILIVIGTFFFLYFILIKHTNSDVPLWDAMVSAFAWAGMWLLAKRKIENWIYLNISNLISIPLLLHKGLILYTLLTLFLFIIAIFGYLDWKKILKNKELLT